ncbi:MAG: ABC transporter substrate-binding protein [Armatimonadota bacterium]
MVRLDYRIMRWILLWTCILLISKCWFSTKCYAQTLTLWHPWTQGQSTVNKLALEYRRQTGVRIQVRVFNPQTYNPWGGGSQPDIIGFSNPTRGTIARNAQLGRLYNMGPYIQQAWYADLWSGPVSVFDLSGTEAPQGRPGVYGLPLTAYVKVFIYNRSMFRRASVSPPRTWSNFLLISPRLRRLGVIPLAGGFDGTYPSFPLIYERSYLGNHYLLETYFGSYPYTGSRWIDNFNVYEEIRRYGLSTYNTSQMSRITAEKYFLDRRCAIILDGQWFESTRRRYAPSFNEWGVFGPPEDRRAQFLPSAPGGVAEGVVINAKSVNKMTSIRFLRWLTEPAQQVRLANGIGSLPISVRASNSPSLNSSLRVFTPHMRYTAIDRRYNENPAVLARLYTGARNVIRGIETSDQVLRAVQRLAR